MVSSKIFTWILVFVSLLKENFINARDASARDDLCERLPNLLFCKREYFTKSTKTNLVTTTTSLITIPFVDDTLATNPPTKTTSKNEDNPSKYCWNNLKSYQYFCLGAGSEDEKAKTFCPSYESDCNLVPSPLADEVAQPPFIVSPPNSGRSANARPVNPVIFTVKSTISPDPNPFCSQYRALFLHICDPQQRRSNFTPDAVKFCQNYSSVCV